MYCMSGDKTIAPRCGGVVWRTPSLSAWPGRPGTATRATLHRRQLRQITGTPFSVAACMQFLNAMVIVEGIVTKCSLVRPKVLRWASMKFLLPRNPMRPHPMCPSSLQVVRSTHYCRVTGKFTNKARLSNFRRLRFRSPCCLSPCRGQDPLSDSVMS